MDPVQRAYLIGNIQSADSLTLVCLLYEYALRAVQTAREMLQKGDLSGKSAAISKASDALSLLISSLSREGGEISSNLLGLYSYIQTRLLEANLRHSDPPLAEVRDLLTTLQSGWKTLGGSEAAVSLSGRPSVPPDTEPSQLSARVKA